MKKFIVLLYSVLCYTIGMLMVGGYALYLANIPLLPFMNEEPNDSFVNALLVNVLILFVFSLQHSGMARKAFKKKLTQWIPAAAERSTFVLLSGLMLFLVMSYWQPLSITLYDVRNTYLAVAILIVYWTGWGLMLLSSFQIDHFQLFGLKQAWFNLRNRTEDRTELTVPFLYRLVRHPLYLGIFIFHWATPYMTAERLMLAVGITIYLYVGIAFEERDLVQEFGEKYLQYRKRVPKLIPITKPKAK